MKPVKPMKNISPATTVFHSPVDLFISAKLSLKLIRYTVVKYTIAKYS